MVRITIGKRIVLAVINFLWRLLSRNEREYFIEDKLADTLDCNRALNCYPTEDSDQVLHDYMVMLDYQEVWDNLDQYVQEDLIDMIKGE